MDLKDHFSASSTTGTIFYYFCLMFFAGLLKIIPLGVGFSTTFLLWFHTFFVPGGLGGGRWGIRPLKKFPGGWSDLELTDTLNSPKLRGLTIQEKV